MFKLGYTSIDKFFGVKTSHVDNTNKRETYTSNSMSINNNINNHVSINNTSVLQTPYINVYTDGSCVNNGKPNAIAGIGVYFGENDVRNVSERVIGKQTNNTGELSAIIKVFEVLKQDIIDNKVVHIYTDSEYAIKCCNNFGSKICNNTVNKKPVPNKELVMQLHTLFNKHHNVHIKHINSHTGLQDQHSLGNEGADTLANKAVQKNIDQSSRNTHKQQCVIDPGYKLTFGKYENYTLEHVYDVDKHYMIWCSKKIKNQKIKSIIKTFLSSKNK